ncbi:MAG TPA: transcriptional regulator, partial [Candidatus Dormibacteraeota bacterium]|nr:transcriptional regulator [Candidatus Dormibacteraeota bacterium]
MATFRPAGGPYATSGVLARLAGLWGQAQKAGGRVSQAELAREAGVPVSTLGGWASGQALPRDAAQVERVGAVLARWAVRARLPLAEWERLLDADQTALGHGEPRRGPGHGQLISALTDPFVLEVHRPVEVDGPAGAGLPVLPPYIRRAHDEDLAVIVGRAAGGRSGMAVLVGGSSTGKTRACWEALSLLPAGWRLWHPFDPTRPEAALGDLARVGPQTVVWLNETQLYLDTPGDTGERVAAALTRLLTDPARAPALVLGTLWPVHWDALTRSRDTRPQACKILDGTSIPVPAAFTGPALGDLWRAAAGDPRLAAAATAPDGQVTQHLAGAPELLARYRNAPPVARALIDAAMDGRRLGHSLALPHALLEAAAPAYLTDAEWDQLGEDWLEQALAYTAAPCKGTAGPVTRIRPRPETGRTDVGPAYKLADYLDQHGRRYRSDQFPPDGLWTAAGRHARPEDQATLGDAARSRGLYRHAAQLCKNAARRGNPSAAIRLIADLHERDPSDYRPASWVATRMPLDDLDGMARLLSQLRGAGAVGPADELAARAAAGVPLNDPDGVAGLLGSMRGAGAVGPADELAARAAASIPLNDLVGVARLLGSMREAGAAVQADQLATRLPVADVPLNDPDGVARLLNQLREVGAIVQAGQLAARAAAGIPL